MAYTYDYPRPLVTADVVLFAAAGRDLQILLIRRRSPPFQGLWALPGGFLEMDEELEQAARRELSEETGITLSGPLREVGLFGKVGRDPRGRTLTLAYLGVYGGAPPQARAGDDAAGATWVAVKQVPALAFDHNDIVAAALKTLHDLAQQPAELRALMGEGASFEEFHALSQAVQGRTLDRANLRRRLRRRGS
ncbi:MAG: NUDIX hydrolase [Gammaproteobacteria bacterium]